MLQEKLFPLEAAVVKRRYILLTLGTIFMVATLIFVFDFGIVFPKG